VAGGISGLALPNHATGLPSIKTALAPRLPHFAAQSQGRHLDLLLRGVVSRHVRPQARIAKRAGEAMTAKHVVVSRASWRIHASPWTFKNTANPASMRAKLFPNVGAMADDLSGDPLDVRAVERRTRPTLVSE